MPNNIQEKARALFDRGKLAKAKALYKKISKRDSSDDTAWIMLGIINRKLGLPVEAAACYRKALAIQPDRPETLNNLANALKEQGSPAAAIQYFTKAVALKPDFVDALANLGNAYFDCKDYKAGSDCFQRLLSIQPDFPGAHLNLGLACFQQGDFAAAESCYRKALTIDPLNPLNHYNLSQALYAQIKFAAALQPCRESVRLQPGDAASWLHLGVVLAALDRIDEATEAFARANGLDAELVRNQVHTNLVEPIAEDALLPDNTPLVAFIYAGMQRLNQCDWDQRDEFLSHLQTITETELKSGKAASMPAFGAISLPLAPELQLDIAKSQSSAIARHMAAASCKFSFTRQPKDRLHVGYLSADFQNHAIAHVTQSLFGAHDRRGIAVCGYSLNRNDGSGYYERIAGDCDRFTVLTELSNVEAARKIHADGIQVLVDLMGHTRFARQEILALRPAPVQVQHLGYPGSVQAEYIDYLIADAWVAPSSTRSLFSEQLVYMPECYFCTNDQQEIAASGTTRRDHGLPDDGIVFACFNQSYKLEPVMFDVWMNILRQVPGSVLWLANFSPPTQANLRARALARGVAEQRLVFKFQLDSLPLFIEQLQLADLGLDTLLYNGHATTTATLWAGIPIITCPQQSFASRVTASQLHNIGLPELISDNLKSYQHLAVHLARHPHELAELKTKLQHNRLAQPLFNTQRYARHLEQAYRMMWDVYTAGDPPRNLYIPALPR